jgi:hypothetical protein
MWRVARAYLLAVLASYLVASVAATQTVLQRVEAMGLPVSLAMRLRTTAQDLFGLAGSYLPLIAIALALAFPVAAGLARLAPRQRQWLFLLAGGVALLALHAIMKAVLGVSGIAATREWPGLLLQGLAGVFGGLCFVRLRRDRPRE